MSIDRFNHEHPDRLPEARDACSFCFKPRRDAASMVSGAPTSTGSRAVRAFICHACIILAAKSIGIVAHDYVEPERTYADDFESAFDCVGADMRDDEAA